MKRSTLKNTAAAILLAALMLIAAALPALAEGAEPSPPEDDGAELALPLEEEAENAAPEEEAELEAPEEEAELEAPEEAAIEAPAEERASRAEETEVTYTLETPEITLSNNAVSTGIKVSWDAVSGAQYYKVLRKSGANGSWIAQTVTTKKTYTDTTGSSGTVYYYKVRCCDSTGNTMLSPNTEGKAIMRLKSPTLYSQKNTSTGISLSFGKPVGTVTYDIARKRTDGTTWVTLSTGGDKVKISSPFLDETAVETRSYYYRVRAKGSFVDETGAKQTVISVWAYFEDPITRLYSPAVTAQLTTSAVKLTWDAVPGAESYAVLRKTETGSWIKKAVITSTSWTDNEANSGKTYQYKVRCVDASGESYQSANPTEVTTQTFMRAPAVTSSENLAEGLMIDWGGVDGADHYIVYRKTATGTSWVKKAEVTESNYVDTTVKSGNSYYYTVRSVHANGTESLRYTNVDLLTYIGMPTPVSAVNGPEGVTFTWEAPAGAEYFRVYRKYTDNGGWTSKEVVHGTSFTDVNVISGVAYHYTVRPVDETGGNLIGPRDDTGVRTFFLRQPKLKSVENADGGVLISYSTVAGADRYDILRAEAGGEFAVVGSAPKGAGEYLDTSAVFETDYVYTVMAVSETETATPSSCDPEGLAIHCEDISCILYVNKPIMGLYTDYTNSSTAALYVKYMDRMIYLETAKTYASGSWIKVEFNNGEYYFWQPADAEPYTVHHHSGFQYTGSTQFENDLIALAMDMYTWPIKYRHGEANGIPAEDGTYGFDCSGFAAYVLKNVMQPYVPTYWVTTTIGVLYRTETIYNKGIDGEFSASTVSVDDLRPGDLLFFDLTEGVDPEEMGDTVTHASVYLGNNEFIHCTHSDYGVEGRNIYIMPLSYQYLTTLVAVRRYLPETVTAADVTMYVATKATVRAEMRWDAEAIETLGAQTPVTVRFTSVDNTTGEPNWAYVEYGEGKAGFVQLKYLTDSITNEQQKRWVAVTSLRLYEQPSTSSSYIEVLIRTEVMFNGQYGSSKYYKVTYNNETRYVYVKSGSDIDSLLTVDIDTLLAGIGQMVVTKGAKLRSNMDSSNDDSVIGTLSQGDEVTLIAVSSTGTWSYVRTDSGLYGFVLSSCIREKTQDD